MQTSRMHQILDLARWAPSGDNTQPWRFEILDETHLVVHGRDTRASCIYDLDGRPSQISIGALIETMAVAASAHGLSLRATRRTHLAEHQPTFDVSLVAQDNLVPSLLLSAIPLRSVQRRPMHMRALTAVERQQLENAVGPSHEVLWFAGQAARLRWASLLWANAGLRLRLPEAFETHRSVIQWGVRFSTDRIPDQALGVDKLTLILMRNAMTSWDRINFLNTWLGGTLAPRLLMDVIPALACAAHVAIRARAPLVSVDDYVAGGRAVARFWLTATGLGLQHQPAITPLVFNRYLREGRSFTTQQPLIAQAQAMSARLERMLDGQAASTVWLGRIGQARPAAARSERLPLHGLLLASPASAQD